MPLSIAAICGLECIVHLLEFFKVKFWNLNFKLRNWCELIYDVLRLVYELSFNCWVCVQFCGVSLQIFCGLWGGVLGSFFEFCIKEAFVWGDIVCSKLFRLILVMSFRLFKVLLMICLILYELFPIDLWLLFEVDGATAFNSLRTKTHFVYTKSWLFILKLLNSYILSSLLYCITTRLSLNHKFFTPFLLEPVPPLPLNQNYRKFRFNLIFSAEKNILKIFNLES